MRPIKFRAWHPEWSEMIYTAYSPVFAKHEFFPFEFALGFSHYPQDDKWVLMQFTGLQDKSGKNIYEGDVVRYSHWNTVDGLSPLGNDDWKEGDVYFDEGRFVVRGNEIWETLSYINIEAIGNIYQHPELIPQQQKQ